MIVRFDSMTELVAYARRSTGDATQGAGSRWDGGSFANAVQLATAGWPEGREGWAAAQSADFAQFNVPAPSVTYDVAGAMPDIPRAIAGDPACFADVGNDGQVKPALTIVVNITANAYVSADAIRNRGLAILTAVDNAEAAGWTVEVIGAFSSTGNPRRDNLTSTWPIKPAGQPVDLDRFAFVLAHVSMLRRLAFAVHEVARPGWSASDNSAVEMDAADRPVRCCYFGQITGAAADTCATPAGAMEYVNAAILAATTQEVDNG